MHSSSRRRVLLLAALLAAAGAVVFFVLRITGHRPDTSPGQAPRLSDLAPPPDWSRLDAYQQSIVRSRFEEQMNDVFTRH